MGWADALSCKSLRNLVDLVRFAPHDLFHAMVVESIAYRQAHQEHKTYTPAIWTSFGPRARFHAGLDLKRSSFRRGMVAATSPTPETWHATCLAHARGRIRLVHSSSRTKKRVSLYCRCPWHPTSQSPLWLTRRAGRG
jgi:hypothetical protein